MQPTLSFHGITRLMLGPLSYHPAVLEDREFWCRTLFLTGADGQVFEVPLFSVQRDGLRTLEERLGTARVIGMGYVPAVADAPPDSAVEVIEGDTD